MTLLVAVRTDGGFLLGSDIAGTISESPDVLQPFPAYVENHNKWRVTGMPSVMWAFSGQRHLAQPMFAWADKAKWQSWSQLKHEVQKEYQRVSRLSRKSVEDSGGDPNSPQLDFGVMFVGIVANEPGIFIMIAPGEPAHVNMAEVPKFTPCPFGSGVALATISWHVVQTFFPDAEIRGAAELAKFIDALCGSSIGLEGPADVWTLTAAGTEKFERDG